MSSDIDVLKLEVRPFVKRSVTTGAGNIGGTTLVDATLTEPNDFWNGMAILIRTGTCAGELRRILDWDLATNTLTVNVAFSAQIALGIQYVMSYPYSDPKVWRLQDDATLDQPNPVQNTWYPVLVPTGNVRIYDIVVGLGPGANETCECELTVDDRVLPATGGNVVAGGEEHVVLEGCSLVALPLLEARTVVNTPLVWIGRGFLIEGGLVGVRVRKITAAGASNLRCVVVHAVKS